jgi:putative ABC transport system permease protein
VVAFFDDLLARIEALPGVTGAAVTNSLPPDGLSETDSFLVEDRPPSPDRGAPVGPILSVSDDYIRVLRVPLIRGRWFSDVDRGSSAPVVVISAALARQYFGGIDPIGRRMKQVADCPHADSNPWLTVVGIVGDVKYAGVAGQTGPAFYLPLRQSAFRNQNLIVRAPGDPSTTIARIRELLRAVDPNLPLADIRTMEERLWASSGESRFRTLLMALFGVMGLTLAAIGIYGVVAYSVTQRTRELGVRAALGATRRDLMRMVLADGLRLATIGAALGLGLALVSGRIVAAFLFATNPADPGVIAGATGVLMFVAVAAVLLPARRAADVDPIVALRAE